MGSKGTVPLLQSSGRDAGDAPELIRGMARLSWETAHFMYTVLSRGRNESRRETRGRFSCLWEARGRFRCFNHQVGMQRMPLELIRGMGRLSWEAAHFMYTVLSRGRNESRIQAGGQFSTWIRY